MSGLDDRGGVALLDDRRTVEVVPGARSLARVDRRVVPARRNARGGAPIGLGRRAGASARASAGAAAPAQPVDVVRRLTTTTGMSPSVLPNSSR